MEAKDIAQPATDEVLATVAQGSGRSILQMVHHIINSGATVAPRGAKILEIEDGLLTLSPMFPCMSFEDRKINIQYAKQEWIWKLSGDRFDDSIAEHAKAWNGLKDVDGGYNSNYGQYFFGKQNGLEWVVNELIRDKDSRRAVIPMLNQDHLRTNNPDHVCTESISFRIRGDALNMSVNMRSNDFIWGFTNDAITFSCLYRMVFALLRPFYPELAVGVYCHKADSLHIYERHWPMARQIATNGMEKFTRIDIPMIEDAEEARLLIATKGKLKLEDLDKYAFSTAFYRWLIS